jgi:hypothetical protein
VFILIPVIIDASSNLPCDHLSGREALGRGGVGEGVCVIGDVEHLLMATQVMLHFRCTWCTEGDMTGEFRS